MNVTELLRQLEAEQDHATARVDSLQQQIDGFAATLAQARVHLAELQTARKVVEGIAQPGTEPQPAATPDSYQRLLTVFNDRPEQSFRARELHELLELPTDEASVKSPEYHCRETGAPAAPLAAGGGCRLPRTLDL